MTGRSEDAVEMEAAGRKKSHPENWHPSANQFRNAFENPGFLKILFFVRKKFEPKPFKKLAKTMGLGWTIMIVMFDFFSRLELEDKSLA